MVKIKKFCASKGTIKKLKRWHWHKMAGKFIDYMPDKGFVSKTNKELITQL